MRDHQMRTRCLTSATPGDPRRPDVVGYKMQHCRRQDTDGVVEVDQSLEDPSPINLATSPRSACTAPVWMSVASRPRAWATTTGS